MKRILITMTEEQHIKLKALAGSNVSGFIQRVIETLTIMKEKRNATHNGTIQTRTGTN